MNPGYQSVHFRAELPLAGLPAAFGVVTACNPDGKTVNDKENLIATESLRSALLSEGYFFFPVMGGSADFSHAEPGFGVLFPSPEAAVEWGQKYQQEAIFWIIEGRVHLISCSDHQSIEIGAWNDLAEPDARKPIFHHLGNLQLLHIPKTALFASTKCPGSVILSTYDQAARWRDEGHCVISGFHSPIEKECLSILLRGTSPIIICPARNLPKIIPPEWREAIAQKRMLLISCFSSSESRITAALADRRNEYVASIADDVWLAHAGEDSKLKQWSEGQKK